jgi:peptide deformylase
VFQHEVDHLDGVLLLEHLDADQRKQALRALRQRSLSADALH